MIEDSSITPCFKLTEIQDIQNDEKNRLYIYHCSQALGLGDLPIPNQWCTVQNYQSIKHQPLTPGTNRKTLWLVLHQGVIDYSLVGYNTFGQ